MSFSFVILPRSFGSTGLFPFFSNNNLLTGNKFQQYFGGNVTSPKLFGKCSLGSSAEKAKSLPARVLSHPPISVPSLLDLFMQIRSVKFTSIDTFILCDRGSQKRANSEFRLVPVCWNSLAAGIVSKPSHKVDFLKALMVTNSQRFHSVLTGNYTDLD